VLAWGQVGEAGPSAPAGIAETNLPIRDDDAQPAPETTNRKAYDLLSSGSAQAATGH
jgi:hypothetical protein